MKRIVCARLHSLADLDILHACLKSQRQESNWMQKLIGPSINYATWQCVLCFSLDNVAAAMSPRWVRALFRQGGEEAC